MNTKLEFHPLADIFPLMEGAKFDALVADIKANGQHARIVLKDGMILDGRNRYRACRELGIEPSLACEAYCDLITDPAAYVISANIHRRDLTAKQRREILVKLVAAQPEKSDRAIAAEAKVDHHQVARARKKAKTATGTKVPVEKKRTGKDGKARRLPLTKKKPPPAASQGNSVDAEQSGRRMSEQIAALEPTIAPQEPREAAGDDNEPPEPSWAEMIDALCIVQHWARKPRPPVFKSSRLTSEQLAGIADYIWELHNIAAAGVRGRVIDNEPPKKGARAELEEDAGPLPECLRR
jgi:ParB-like chromosome segregation protein Spo0J